MPNVDAIVSIDAVADQQKFLSDPDSRICIVLQIWIREANKLRIRPDPNHTWSFLWPLKRVCRQTVGSISFNIEILIFLQNSQDGLISYLPPLNFSTGWNIIGEARFLRSTGS
jgi:hypothetical protein